MKISADDPACPRVAIKRVSAKKLIPAPATSPFQDLRVEWEMTRLIHCMIPQHVVRPLSHSPTYETQCYEWADGGSLRDWMRAHPTRITDEWVMRIFFQVTFALHTCISVYPRFRHNDLSYDNVLCHTVVGVEPRHACYMEHDLFVSVQPGDVWPVLADFEHASIPGLLDNYTQLGVQCNIPTLCCDTHPVDQGRSDLFYFAFYLFQEITDEDLYPAISYAVRRNVVAEVFGNEVIRLINRLGPENKHRMPPRYRFQLPTPHQVLVERRVFHRYKKIFGIAPGVHYEVILPQPSGAPRGPIGLGEGEFRRVPIFLPRHNYPNPVGPSHIYLMRLPADPDMHANDNHSIPSWKQISVVEEAFRALEVPHMNDSCWAEVSGRTKAFAEQYYVDPKWLPLLYWAILVNVCSGSAVYPSEQAHHCWTIQQWAGEIFDPPEHPETLLQMLMQYSWYL